ncbi:MAG: hypothetical protein HC938_16570 [Nitrospira sp.]|nr:hypothetical protein [Nitrospira sp.]
MADISFHYSILIKRIVTGLILGLLAGAVQVWFFKRDLVYLWASAAAGGLYMRLGYFSPTGFDLPVGKSFWERLRVSLPPWCGGRSLSLWKICSCNRLWLACASVLPMPGLINECLELFQPPAVTSHLSFRCSSRVIEYNGNRFLMHKDNGISVGTLLADIKSGLVVFFVALPLC